MESLFAIIKGFQCQCRFSWQLKKPYFLPIFHKPYFLCFFSCMVLVSTHLVRVRACGARHSTHTHTHTHTHARARAHDINAYSSARFAITLFPLTLPHFMFTWVNKLAVKFISLLKLFVVLYKRENITKEIQRIYVIHNAARYAQFVGSNKINTARCQQSLH